MKRECEAKNRLLYVDILNILACIAVVALHQNKVVHYFEANHSSEWSASLIVACLFFWAVPVFLMITGTTLMQYRERYDTKTFFKKRFIKIVIPFIFWAIFMIVWKYNTGLLSISKISIKTILTILFTNGEETIYYFMFVIIGVYLTLPVISVLSEEKYRKVLWYAVITFFIFNSVLPTILDFCQIPCNTYMMIQFTWPIFYCLLGFLLSHENFDKNTRILVYVAAIISIIFRYIVTYVLSTKEGKTDRILFQYSQFHAVFLASAVFLFIKNLKFDKIQKSEKICNIISKIASCTFGIYLIHMIINYYELKIFNINIWSWQWRTFGIISTYAISLVIVYIIKKIPILKRLVP